MATAASVIVLLVGKHPHRSELRFTRGGGGEGPTGPKKWSWVHFFCRHGFLRDKLWIVLRGLQEFVLGLMEIPETHVMVRLLG